MEKRWCERKKLNVGVEIFLHGQMMGTAKAQDIGLGGTFLGIDSSADMQKDADVELVFRLMSGPGEPGTRHKVSARVARVTDRGVGFKFCNFNTGVFRSLQEIMTYKSGEGLVSSAS